MRWPLRPTRPSRRLVALLGFGVVAVFLAALAASLTGPQRAPGGARASLAARPTGANVAPVSAALGAPTRAAPPATTSAPVAGGSGASASPSLPALAPGQMLIRSATIEIQAANPAALVDSVRQIATAATDGADAGYVADERLQTSDTSVTATITIAVPSATFAAVMDQLRRLGTKVLDESSSSQDVTEQYVDVDAQLQALRATQAQLLTLLGKAQSVADTLAIQRELASVNSQINQLVGRENYLKSHSAYSTIVVTITPPVAVEPPTSPAKWQPIAVLTGALHALAIVARDLADAAIWLLVFGLPLAALVGLGVLFDRLVVRRARARV